VHSVMGLLFITFGYPIRVAMIVSTP